jgi:hypothetical protein
MWFGTAVANILCRRKGEKVRVMKIVTSVVAAVLFIGTLGAINSAMGADDVIYKQQLTPGSYCHLEFPTIRDQTLAGDHRFSKVQTMVTPLTLWAV